MADHAGEGDGLTLDGFLNGRIQLGQPAAGFRAGADSILLAAALSVEPGAAAVEAGSGAGAALIAAAHLRPGVRWTGIERDPAMATLARANITRNATPAEIIEADVFAWRPPETVDCVFANPPFYAAGRPAPKDPGKRAAHLSEASPGRWAAHLADWLRGGGRLTLIHDVAALGEILAALEGRLGGVEIAPIRPRPQLPAARILVRARKGARAPLRLLRGLDLHGASGQAFSPEAEALFRGEALFAWA